MGVKTKPNVQCPQFAEADFDFTMVTTVAELAVQLPSGAEVIGGQIVITTAFDQAGVLDLGDTGNTERYAKDVDAAALGATALKPTGLVVSGDTAKLNLIWTGATPATAGKGKVQVLYAVKDAGDYNVPIKVI